MDATALNAFTKGKKVKVVDLYSAWRNVSKAIHINQVQMIGQVPATVSK